MTGKEPVTELDPRYSEASAPTPWPDTLAVLTNAELSWLSTVRPDGRPHVTPLPTVWRDDAPHFATGVDERKARNLAANPHCVLTTGTNSHFQGHDVVVEGEARPVTDPATLRGLAEAWREKYDVWRYEVGEGGFRHPGGEAVVLVFRVEPTKVFAFTKGEGTYAQTRYRF